VDPHKIAELAPFKFVERKNCEMIVRRAAIAALADSIEYIYCFRRKDDPKAPPIVIGGLLSSPDKLRRIDEHLSEQGFLIDHVTYRDLLSETENSALKGDREAKGSGAARYVVAIKAGMAALLLTLVASRALRARSRLKRAEKVEKARQDGAVASGDPDQKVGNGSDTCRFTISRSTQPTLSFTLAPGQRVIAQRGALLRKDKPLQSSTASGKMLGLFGGVASEGASVLSGETMYYQAYRNESDNDLTVVLGPSCIGQFLPLDLDEHPGGVTACKGAFFAATPGVKMSIDRSSGWKGAFSGTGLFRQKFSGEGQLFLFSVGELECVELEEGQELVADSDSVFAWDSGVTVDLKRQTVDDAVFNGEGLVVAHISGRGKIWFATRGGSDDASSNGSLGMFSKLIGKFTDWQ
jgi:uncharacterized protein (AIM24 family)